MRVFEEEAKKTGAQFLLQGTIYPDRIESGMGGSATIKSHTMSAACPGIRCSRRKTSSSRSNPCSRMKCAPSAKRWASRAAMVWRQPLPGPGLAVRVVGEITRRKGSTSSAGATPSTWKSWKTPAFPKRYGQSFAVLTGSKTVGVMGDGPHLRLLRSPARRHQRRRHDRRSRRASLPGAEKMRQPHHQ